MTNPSCVLPGTVQSCTGYWALLQLLCYLSTLTILLHITKSQFKCEISPIIVGGLEVSITECRDFTVTRQHSMDGIVMEKEHVSIVWVCVGQKMKLADLSLRPMVDFLNPWCGYCLLYMATSFSPDFVSVTLFWQASKWSLHFLTMHVGCIPVFCQNIIIGTYHAWHKRALI